MAFLTTASDGTASSLLGNSFDLITGGEEQVKFWSLQGRNLVAVSGVIAEGASPREVLHATTAVVGLAAPQMSASGDSNGSVWLWRGSTRYAVALGQHIGPVTALTAFSSARAGGGPSGVISAGCDSVKIWDTSTCALLQEFTLSALLTKIDRAEYLAPTPVPPGVVAAQVGGLVGGTVTSVAVDAAFRRLLISMSAGIVLELAHDSGAVVLVSEVRTLNFLPRPSHFISGCCYSFNIMHYTLIYPLTNTLTLYIH